MGSEHATDVCCECTFKIMLLKASNLASAVQGEGLSASTVSASIGHRARGTELSCTCIEAQGVVIPLQGASSGYGITGDLSRLSAQARCATEQDVMCHGLPYSEVPALIY